MLPGLTHKPLVVLHLVLVFWVLVYLLHLRVYHNGTSVSTSEGAKSLVVAIARLWHALFVMTNLHASKFLGLFLVGLLIILYFLGCWF